MTTILHPFIMLMFLMAVLACHNGEKSGNYVRSKMVATGTPIDSLNKVVVYYNGGGITGTSGRHLTADGYNLGLKYQCVEFVKRYYYYALNHKMPHTYGHAKDFFDKGLGNQGYNADRDLYQFRNAGTNKPQVNDILVFDGWPGNPYGHVAIISKTANDHIEIIQQNVGMSSRRKINLVNFQHYWTIADESVLGWLGIRK